VPASGITALLALGLRPFYLAAAIFAALAIPIWFAAYSGWLILDGGLPGVAWHAHEMLFGFAPAVIAGFLLAAVRNWTNLPTPTGASLVALLAVWLAGRVALLTGPPTLAMIIDAAFLPVLAAVLALPILRAKNLRNSFIPLILALLAAANVALHLAYRDPQWSAAAPIAIRVAADAITCLMAVIAGRVIPAFAANAISGFKPYGFKGGRGALDSIAIGLLVVVTVLDIATTWWTPPAAVSGPLFMLAGGVHIVRLAGWKPWAMRRDLLLVILPVSYAWIPVYLLLRGTLATSAMELPPLALHALVIGAMGGLMLSMMTRSALGHTGRALVAQKREAAIYLAIHTAAVVRVVLPSLWPAGALVWVAAASVLWSTAFAIFAIGYWPVLTKPRVDGRPG
jgi:uncharacterized protein involved in response to NO